MPEMPVPQNPTSCTEELQREGLVHTSGISQDIPLTGRAHFENELTE